jgi:hypothetical protein
MIHPMIWEFAIKPGAHILQSMLVSKQQTKGQVCPFPSCNETLIETYGNDRIAWYVSSPLLWYYFDTIITSISSNCGRSSLVGQRTNVLQLVASAEEVYPITLNQVTRPRNIFGPTLPRFQNPEDDINHFRRIRVLENMNLIETIQEANELLAEDPKDARALQFIAWSKFPHKSNIDEETSNAELETIIDLLEKSTESSEMVSK